MIMTLAFQNLILGISGTIILLLLGILGYLLKDKTTSYENKGNTLTHATENLTKAVTTLEKTVVRIETGILAQNEVCKLRHELIEERFKNVKVKEEAKGSSAN